MKKQEIINMIDCLTRLVDAITRSRTLSQDLQDTTQSKLLELVNSL
jgi:hypothetical protein